MVNVKNNLVGKKFGRLTVLEQVEDYIAPKTGKHTSRWLCECSCDNHTRKIIQGNNLTSGKINSCGCLAKEQLSKLCKLNLTKEPIQVTEHITYLGEIPISNDFEPRYTIGKSVNNGEKTEDNLEEDSAIVYKANDGLFIITGCSHSGICNIIEYAKKVCNDNRILGVIGGFHLFDNDDRLKNTINYLKDNNIKYLYPCHCVSLTAKVEMAKQLKINEVGVGLEIEI